MRNVRNFWINLNVDGRRNEVGTGPRNRDGGFYQEIWLRRAGDPVLAARIHGEADLDGNLVLRITTPDGQRIQIEGSR